MNRNNFNGSNQFLLNSLSLSLSLSFSLSFFLLITDPSHLEIHNGATAQTDTVIANRVQWTRPPFVHTILHCFGTMTSQRSLVPDSLWTAISQMTMYTEAKESRYHQHSCGSNVSSRVRTSSRVNTERKETLCSSRKNRSYY